MDVGSAFRLIMSSLGSIISFYLGYYILQKGKANWIRRAFAVYCICGGFFVLTRVLRGIITLEQYETFGTFLVYVFGMGGAPVGIALFSRLLTHGEESTFTAKVFPILVLPPLITALIGVLLDPSKVTTVSIGHVQVFDPSFRLLYILTTFGWIIYAAVNMAIGVKRISQATTRAKMEGIRNGLFGIAVTSFFAYGIATNMGWYNVMAIGDLLIVIFQAYIAFIYMKE
ncbi:MAG: hypothetical protein HXS53_03130 [Theionarchaea archaeon]|nr:hypothetical protein [Theionarchaea archaeon]